MTEEATQTQVPPEAPALEFPAVVMAVLEARKIKPRCMSCDCVGWANFSLFPVPVITPTAIQGQVLLSACFICVKCGAETRRNLPTLGITIQQEERRVIVPGQEAPKPIILTG